MTRTLFIVAGAVVGALAVYLSIRASGGVRRLLVDVRDDTGRIRPAIVRESHREGDLLAVVVEMTEWASGESAPPVACTPPAVEPVTGAGEPFASVVEVA